MEITADENTQTGLVFGRPDSNETPHERVVFGHDAKTGLKAIIAIHSTVLGPALGGTRFFPYPDEQSAITDVLRLSRGMTYKAATAGLELGGGKAVIIGDPGSLKKNELLESYGRLVESLDGLYITAGDVGTTSDDMDVIGGVTDHVVARTAAAGGSGDSAPLTAFGVFQSMHAAANRRWGSPSLEGRLVGVEGIGKVGYHLIDLLLAAGAEVVACDLDPRAEERAKLRFPRVTFDKNVLAADIDVYAPCAMGATLTPQSVLALRAEIVCGAANNQLFDASVEFELGRRGITWVPDYVANSGGLIQVAGELRKKDPAIVRREVEDVFDTVEGILLFAADNDVTAGEAANHFAESRLDAATNRHALLDV